MADRALTAAVARRACIPRTVAARAVEAALDEIRARLQEDGEIAVSGFGRFRRAPTGRRIGRNFATGETVEVPSREVVRFDAFDSVMTGRRARWHIKGGAL